jgi:hypothetical protein
MGLFNWVNWCIALILWVPIVIALNYAIDVIGSSHATREASSYSQHRLN